MRAWCLLGNCIWDRRHRIIACNPPRCLIHAILFLNMPPDYSPGYSAWRFVRAMTQLCHKRHHSPMVSLNVPTREATSLRGFIHKASVNCGEAHCFRKKRLCQPTRPCLHSQSWLILGKYPIHSSFLKSGKCHSQK